MTVAQLVIVPGILLAAFLGGIFWLAARWTSRQVAMMRAEKAAAEVPVRLLRQQSDAIDAAITALQDPSVRDLFDESLYDQLLQAHRDAGELDMKKTRR